MKLGRKLFGALCVIAIFAGAAFAQRATLSGTVTDQTGAVIAGANITIIKVDQGLKREALTNDEGYFTVPLLPPGQYAVTAQCEGFTPTEIQDIRLHVGDQMALKIELKVAGISEQVLVQSEAILVEPGRSALKRTVDANYINHIPLNGRNFLDLIQLLPGVAVNDDGSVTANDAQGAVLGERAGNNSFLIDGAENNDDFQGGAFARFNQEAISEFEVQQTGYEARFGKASGAIINVATKSGANQFHGSGFLFFRDDKLDSSNIENQQPPALRRYQFGGSLGGPLRRDRSWFFLAFEQLNEQRGLNIPQADVPAALLAMEDFSQVPDTTRPSLFAKWSHNISRANFFNASFNYTRNENRNEVQAPSTGRIALPSYAIDSVQRTYTVTLDDMHRFSETTFMSLSFNFRDGRLDQNKDKPTTNSRDILFLDRGRGFSLGTPPGSQLELAQRYVSFSGDMNHYRRLIGDHTFQLGGRWINSQINGTNSDVVANVVLTVAPLFPITGTEGFLIPQGFIYQTPRDALTDIHNDSLGFYAQDSWKLHPKLTLNLGVRWDYEMLFKDKNNLAPRLGVAVAPDSRTVIRAHWGEFYDHFRLGLVQAVPEFGGFSSTDFVDFEYPRLGFEDFLSQQGVLPGLGQFVFRQLVSSPLFLYEHFQIPIPSPTNIPIVTRDNVQSLTGLSPDQFLAEANRYLASFGIPFLPVDFSPRTGYLRQRLSYGNAAVVQAEDPVRTPHTRAVSVGVEREILRDYFVSVEFVHRDIKNISGIVLTNLSPAARTCQCYPPPTTDGGPVKLVQGGFFDGTYNALLVSLRKNFRQRFQVLASYTLAKGTDNAPGIGLGNNTGSGTRAADNLNLEFDRGNSPLVFRHQFVASAYVELPYGFAMSPIFRARSGVPFSAAGTLYDPDGDGLRTSRVPGTRKNQFFGPAFYLMDMRVEKGFALREAHRLSVLVEFFNLFNRANPRTVANQWDVTANRPGPTFGQTLLPSYGREIQLGLRYQF